MVKVLLWGTLRHATDGQAEVEVEARNFKELLDRLAVMYPGLEPQIRRGVSMALAKGWISSGQRGSKSQSAVAQRGQ